MAESIMDSTYRSIKELSYVHYYIFLKMNFFNLFIYF